MLFISILFINISTLTQSKMATPSAPLYPNLDEGAAPTLPKTPPNAAQGYRLNLIQRLQMQLEAERDQQRTLCKKYHRSIDAIDAIDTTLIAISTGLGIGGVGLLTTVVAAPIVLGLEIGAACCGIIAVAGKCVGRCIATKALKHDKIGVLADSKINTITSYVSKALNDEEITDLEFQMIKGEVEKYYILKDEIRRSHRTAISSSEKKKLIQLGRDEARKSFMKKIQGGS